MNGRMSLEDLIGSAKDSGWDWFEALQAKFGGNPAERSRLEGEATALFEAAARILASPDGQRVFGTLVDRTLNLPVFLTHLELSNDAVVREGAYREGQNFIVMQVIRWAARGRPGQPITIGKVNDERTSGSGGGGGRGGAGSGRGGAKPAKPAKPARRARPAGSAKR